jgi:uncharacterized protein (DUF433 family)
MIDWSTCAAVEAHPGVYSGAWVFRGTRVPVAALFENLEGGASRRASWPPGRVSGLSTKAREQRR